MGAPSDGAIVLTLAERPCAPTLLQILRWYIPDMIIATWLGATMGACLSHCIAFP
jgi:hypothetical protein